MEILRKFWDLWKRFGQAMGDFIARLVLTLFYFTIFAPFGLGVRLLGDPLAIKQDDDDKEDNEAPLWLSRTTSDLTIDDARRLS